MQKFILKKESITIGGSERADDTHIGDSGGRERAN